MTARQHSIQIRLHACLLSLLSSSPHLAISSTFELTPTSFYFSLDSKARSNPFVADYSSVYTP